MFERIKGQCVDYDRVGCIPDGDCMGRRCNVFMLVWIHWVWEDRARVSGMYTIEIKKRARVRRTRWLTIIARLTSKKVMRKIYFACILRFVKELVFHSNKGRYKSLSYIQTDAQRYII